MPRLPQKLIKLGFYLLYNQLAFIYDLIAWLVSFGQWANWRRTGLEYLQPGPVLELAFGTGGLYVDMKRAGLKVIGIDLSAYMARLTQRRLGRKGLPGDILRARTQALPFPDASFANAIATFPTKYIFDPATLSEVYRVLACQVDRPACLVIVMQGDLRDIPGLRGAVEWLYRYTGERDPLTPDPLALLTVAGFEAQWETAHFQATSAQVIIARKYASHQDTS
jgi:ubiquinone/menaquinone biosynthesis C-methylase UbiE